MPVYIYKNLCVYNIPILILMKAKHRVCMCMPVYLLYAHFHASIHTCRWHSLNFTSFSRSSTINILSDIIYSNNDMLRKYTMNTHTLLLSQLMPLIFKTHRLVVAIDDRRTLVCILLVYL